MERFIVCGTNRDDEMVVARCSSRNDDKGRDEKYRLSDCANSNHNDEQGISGMVKHSV